MDEMHPKVRGRSDRKKKTPFTEGLEDLKDAKENFLDIRIRDEEHDLMVSIVRKIDQFLAAIEAKDPNLIDAVDSTPDVPVTPVPAASTRYTESTEISEDEDAEEDSVDKK